MGQKIQWLTFFGGKWGFEKWPEKGANAILCYKLIENLNSKTLNYRDPQMKMEV